MKNSSGRPALPLKCKNRVKRMAGNEALRRVMSVTTKKVSKR